MLDQEIQKKVQKLPVDRQQQVLEFVEFLESKTATGPRSKRHNIIGLLSDFNTDITEEKINEMRREIWGTFPEASR
ncbi:MAG: hypothetical protein A2W35_07035 [Chloroflexi bacterium RBG_16_57_11]|nr:MAG: hypothetical protein A2W35_07035 [Chloroflexi bacterium RBG_16_57_11]